MRRVSVKSLPPASAAVRSAADSLLSTVARARPASVVCESLLNSVKARLVRNNRPSADSQASMHGKVSASGRSW